jgi:hypothetical protein
LAFQKSAVEMRNDIFAAYDLDASVLGYAAETTYAGAVVTDRNVYKKCVKPYWERRNATLTEKLLIPDFGADLVAINEYKPEETPEEKIKRIDLQAKYGAISVNEIRVEFEQEPYEDPMFDEPLITSNQAKMDEYKAGDDAGGYDVTPPGGKAVNEKLFDRFKVWDESKHPRVASGPHGGEFGKGGVKEKPDKKERKTTAKESKPSESEELQSFANMTKSEFERHAWFHGQDEDDEHFGKQQVHGGVTKSFAEATSYAGLVYGKTGGQVRIVPHSSLSESQVKRIGTTGPGHKIIDTLKDSPVMSSSVSIPITETNPHEYLVKKAISLGIDVPDRVLKDYPHLMTTKNSSATKMLHHRSRSALAHAFRNETNGVH